MSNQVGFLGELLATEAAFEWTITGVGDHVGLEVMPLSETLLTNFANDRLFTTMHPHVGFEVAELAELLPACFALIWTVTAMDAGMRR